MSVKVKWHASVQLDDSLACVIRKQNRKKHSSILCGSGRNGGALNEAQ
jgi:NAD(P)H-hydrate repair Nnr-like enzyme with NAD(P)H-hydrate epimerase domain